MLHKATTYDWVGDDVPGVFHLLHSSAGRGALLDLGKNYAKMLAHCDEYLDSVGDHPLNLAATGLALNAYALTGEEKYRNWMLEYVGAWKQRTDANGGNIPTNIGLDGKVGGEYGGRWYKGTYGWNFTIYDGEIEQIAHRNTFTAGSWPGFGNALLVSGDQGFTATLRKQLENIYAQAKTVDGKTMLPQMYGDPRGHKQTGREEWYQYTSNLHTDRLVQNYVHSGDPADLKRVPKSGWIGYLEGNDPAYPEKALRGEIESVRRRVQQMNADATSADTRLADYLMGFNPAETDTLANLTMGAWLPGNIWSLHARLRYFDPVKRRAGLPDHVAALIEKMTGDTVTVNLVNTSALDAAEVVLQSGAYAEHQMESVTWKGAARAVNSNWLSVRLEPSAVGQLTIRMKRYANRPVLKFPWDRPR
jgi:hypothetical protein